MFKNQIIPRIVEKTPEGRLIYDIYSRLLEERIVFLGGPIIDITANLVIAQILLLASKDPKKEIQIYINSPGGLVSDTLAIYDTMQYVQAPISTVCIGTAASGAALLLAAGTKGKRFALPNVDIMLHQIMGRAAGQAIEIEIASKQMGKVKNRLNRILAHHTGQPLKTIEKDTDRDFFLSAEQAKDYGLIDEVIKTKTSTKTNDKQ